MFVEGGKEGLREARGPLPDGVGCGGFLEGTAPLPAWSAGLEGAVPLPASL